MAYYYQYEFISPEEIFANVREELKSYFDTGAMDDMMFPVYVDKCLRKLGRSSYKITQATLVLEDFKSTLPDNFKAVREAWLCTALSGTPFTSPVSFYSQTGSTTIQVSPMVVGGQPCNQHECIQDGCATCQPEIIQAVYKTNNEVMFTYSRSHMLKPGNIWAKEQCSVDYMSNWKAYCGNPNASDLDSFDIRGNKFVTNFRNGIVHLVFYAEDRDENDVQLVPDNYRIMEFIEAFLKYKCFEQLFNNVHDETATQVFQKMQLYKGYADEAFVMADVEIKKQTVDAKMRSIKHSLRRNRKYELSQRSYNGWRRNS